MCNPSGSWATRKCCTTRALYPASRHPELSLPGEWAMPLQHFISHVEPNYHFQSWKPQFHSYSVERCFCFSLPASSVTASLWVFEPLFINTENTWSKTSTLVHKAARQTSWKGDSLWRILRWPKAEWGYPDLSCVCLLAKRRLRGGAPRWICGVYETIC